MKISEETQTRIHKLALRWVTEEAGASNYTVEGMIGGEQ